MAYSKTHSLKFAGIALLALTASLCASAQVLRGTVANGTDKKPAGGDDVILLKIDRGMTEVGRTKSNAQGEFSLPLKDKQNMHAVRVVHDKVSYYQPVVPGSSSVAITVYNSSQTVSGVRVQSQSLILQAQGNTLQVNELFDIHNESQPPVTQPSFSFYLPDGATVEAGQAMREGGMPLKSAPVPQEEKGRYTFPYPVNPGLTHFEVVYKLPYNGTFKFDPKFASPVDNFYVVTPNSIAFSPDSSSQFQVAPANVIDTGAKNVDVHVSPKVSETTKLTFNISGTGVLQQDQSGQQQAAAGGSQQPSQQNELPGGGMGVPNEQPNPLSQGQYAFLGILTVFLAGGAALVFLASNGRATAVAAAPPQSQGAPLLEALKEEIFQLESDRIQGKLSQQDYESARIALDKTLQRAMKKNK